MIAILILVFQFLSEIGYCETSLTITAEYWNVLERCKVSGNKLWQTTAPTLTMCSLHCWNDRRCLSVSYNRNGGTCVTHNVCPSDCGSIGTAAPGWSTLIPNITICFATEAAQTGGNYVGGSGGAVYTDSGLWNERPITAVKLLCSNFVPLIQVKYGSAWGPVHGYVGFPGTEERVLNFARDEYIVRVLSSMGSYINSVQVFTNKATYETCGTYGGTSVNSVGVRLLYISGREGLWLDGIRFHWAESFYSLS